MITIDKDLGKNPYTKERLAILEKSSDPRKTIEEFSREDVENARKSMGETEKGESK